MAKPNSSVDGYIRKSKDWQAHLNALRAILLDSPMTEEIKWRTPCYTLDGKNVAFIGYSKTACVLSFIKGSLLKDPERILIQQTENSQSVRIIRFTTVPEIVKLDKTLRAYIHEAIGVEQAGLKVKLKKVSEFKVPEEFQVQLKSNSELKKAFESLTPGRQRAYLLYFSGAKQSATRASRVQKYVKQILNGKGIDD